ncbi:MAG TPA: glycosyltransferase family 4 protein [Candidatus Baltobacteraceae bacterium]|nr:glycosyltransferase family 4 protein [Candidatus Baltobacteraceae bacterium]
MNERSKLADSRVPQRKLNIWWFSQYASTPDQQFTAQFDLAKRLVERGHRVTFFSAGFSHYRFQEIRLKTGEPWRAEECGGVRFVWIRTPAYARNDWRRARNICAYAWRAFRLARSWEETPDVVIGTTFHPLASLAACATAASKRRPFVFEVKDLWPLTAVEFGRLAPRNPVAKALGHLERFLARRASRIMTTLPGAAEYYERLGVRPESVTWIPNGLELDRYASLSAYSGRLSNPCTLLYAGGMVSANALDTILLAARIEMANRPNVRFVFVGGGQDKPRLVAMAQELRLSNVEFRDAVPKSELHRVMEEADALLLSMRNLPALYRYGMSFNKLCDYAAAGRPILFAGSPSHNLVEEFRCGIVIPPEDPRALSSAIQQFLDMSDAERAEMGRNGIRCAKERFDMAMLAERLEQMLVSIADGSMDAPGMEALRHGAVATPDTGSRRAAPLSQEN